MNTDVFISYASKDKNEAIAVCNALESTGIQCWIAPRNIAPGGDWTAAIYEGIKKARLFLLLLTAASNQSPQCRRETELALREKIPLLPVRLEPVHLQRAMEFLIGPARQLDAAGGSFERHLTSLVHSVKQILGEHRAATGAARPVEVPSPSKGYVFLSYSKSDADFVQRLKAILKRRGYAYWDYSESERDYHSALYRELEERIEGAKAFMCIVTDSWRETEWPASEYLYAREAKVPVFVIQAKSLSRPVPIILNQQTRISMWPDFESGATVLERELDKKGL